MYNISDLNLEIGEELKYQVPIDLFTDQDNDILNINIKV